MTEYQKGFQDGWQEAVESRKVPVSRADVIRSLTDEELVELIEHWGVEDEKLHFCKSECEATVEDLEAEDCRACLLAWLKEKAGKC